jgi:hypothetical protein
LGLSVIGFRLGEDQGEDGHLTRAHGYAEYSRTGIAGSPSISTKWSKEITSMKSASAILRIAFGLAVVALEFFTYRRIIPRVEASEAVELFGHRVLGASGTGCCVAPPSVASV